MMKLFFLLFVLSSCESVFFDTYKIKRFTEKRGKNEIYYNVNKGDNLYLISKKYNISIQKLIKFNNISYPYKIFPNQKIYIPKKRIHVVGKGETLYSISRFYRSDLFFIAKFNNLNNVDRIYVNQKLVIPGHVVAKDKNKIVKNKKNYFVKKNNKKLDLSKNISSKKTQNYKQNFIWPVKGKVLLKYGSNTPGFFNDGINIGSKSGDKVLASNDGEVVYSGNEIPGYGNLILIKHSKNWITAYAHLKKIYKRKGSVVKKGELIGSVGNSGNVKSPQLHFEIRRGKDAVDPLKYLS